MATVADFDLTSMLCDIENMLTEQAVYDEDFVRPTELVCRRVHGLLRDSEQLMGRFPLGAVFPDGDGGIRIEWRCRQRQVRLIVPASPDQKHYVYFQNGGHFDGEDDVSASRLAYYLTWLNDETVPSS